MLQRNFLLYQYSKKNNVNLNLFEIEHSAETYGYRTNANGKSLRNKQVWTLSPSGDGESVVLRSHLDRYIAVDQFGNVTCDQVYFLVFLLFEIFIFIYTLNR